MYNFNEKKTIFDTNTNQKKQIKHNDSIYKRYVITVLCFVLLFFKSKLTYV